MRCVFMIMTVLWLGSAQARQHAEAACLDEVQGRIAWNYEGDRRWNESNLYALCRGTRRATQPGLCFNEVLHGGIDWGGGTRWEWENAIALCQGTSNARATIGCFEDAMHRRGDWRWAIERCGWRETGGRVWEGPLTCEEHVQGQIAWNYHGDRVWDDRYLDRLCRGSYAPAEPGRCFQHVMHGGVNWGGGTRWEPDNALRLCAGSNDANETIGCFESEVRHGQRWEAAIDRCRR